MEKYKLQNLDCAVCANKIENVLKKRDFVTNVTVNFNTATMSIDTTDINQVKKVIKNLEPEVKVVKIDKDNIDDFDFKKGGIALAIFTLFFIIGMVIEFSSLKNNQIFYIAKNSIFILVYIFLGRHILLKAFKNILRGQIFDENFLMSISTIGAFFIGAISEACGVMVFYSIGEFFQKLSLHRSRNSIKSLVNIRPEYANLEKDGNIITISPDDVQVGDIVLVKVGEKIPLDGSITEGDSFLDTKALTGESTPQHVGIGSSVLAGTINTTGILKIEVTKPYKNSSVVRILELVEEATNKKTNTENFLTTFAKYYTPIVVILAILIAVFLPLLFKIPIEKALYRALVLLVISCPCALVISIPLTYFCGIGSSSKNGILVKGSNYLNNLALVKKIAFDKTGTLTKGSFKVLDIVCHGDITKEKLLYLAASVEKSSNHPIAKSIVNFYNEIHEEELNRDVTNYRELAGFGVSATISGVDILVGNSKLLDKYSIDYKNIQVDGNSVVFIAYDGVSIGHMVIGDEIKYDSLVTIDYLKKRKIDVAMLTGDNEASAKSVANSLGIYEYYHSLLPEDKVSIFEKIISEKRNKNDKIAFIGDGINDAPVLSLADIGISMGGIGSDAAIESADVVFMTDSLTKIEKSIDIAKKTRVIVIQNIVFSLGVKILFLGLGAFGLANMWEAVFSDVGVTLIALLNAMRAFK